MLSVEVQLGALSGNSFALFLRSADCVALVHSTREDKATW